MLHAITRRWYVALGGAAILATICGLLIIAVQRVCTAAARTNDI